MTNSEIKSYLKSKIRDELNIIARKLRISGYRGLNKEELVSAILQCDKQTVRRCIKLTWWDRNKNDFYGICTVISLMIGISFGVRSCAYSPKEPHPNVGEPKSPVEKYIIPHEDIEFYKRLSLSKIDSKYKKAISLKQAEEYEEAAKLFSEIYESQPEYPTLARHYGFVLRKLRKDSEALAVYLSMPPSEGSKFKNINIGFIYLDLNRFEKASEYFKLALKDFNRHDNRYWAARALFLYTQSKSIQSHEFLLNTNNFVEIVENDIRNLSDYHAKKDSKFELDESQVLNDILSRRVAAFWLLWATSNDLYRLTENYIEPLKLALKAAHMLPGTVTNTLLDINNAKYIRFLEHLSYLLSQAARNKEIYNSVTKIMEKIVNQSCCPNSQEISDFAVLIQLFYGQSTVQKTIKKTEFEVLFNVNAKSKIGLRFILIESPIYPKGIKKINIDGRKEYIHKEISIISPDTPPCTRLYFKVTTENVDGGKTVVNAYPVIRIRKNK